MLEGFLRSKDYLAKDTVPKAEYERVLKERNLLLQLIDSLPDSIYAKDTEGRFLVSNQKNTELLGKHHSLEVVGKTDFDFYDKELAEKYRQDEIVLLNSSQDVINSEEPNINNLTGEQRWISTTKVIYRDEHGVALGLFGIGRDITTRKLIEEELVKSEEAFRKTINSVPSMIYQLVFRPDGTIVYPFVSEGSRAIYGIEPERIMLDASIITKMWHPDDIGEYMRRVEECRRTLKPFDMECRIVLPDGAIKWLRVHSMPELEPDGGLRFYGVRIDITEQKKLEAQLRQQQIQMNAAADLAQLAFWEGDLQEQRFIFNDQCFALLGTSLAKEGRYGLSIADYLSRFVLPEDVPQSVQHLQSVLENPSLKRGQAMYRIRRADDGSVRYIKVIYNVEHDAEGLPIRVFGPMQDVTEQEEAAQALRQSEEKFRKTVNTIPSVIYQLKFNPDGSYSYPFISDNCTALYEVSAEEAMRDATTLPKMWHPDDVEEYWRQIRHTLDTLTPLDITLRIITPSGKVKWVRVNSNPEKQPDGSIVLYGVRTDITKLKELEAQLRQQQIQMNAAADLAQLAFWEGDLQEQRFIFNDRCFALLGTSFAKEGRYGLSIADYLSRFVLPEDVPQSVQHLQSVLENPSLKRGQAMYRIRRADDGSVRYIKVIYNVERDAEGLPIRVFGPMQDVTEQEEAAQALRQSEEKFRKTVNTVPSVIYQLKFNPDGSYSYPFISDNCAALYEVSAEDAMRDATTLTKMWHPDDVAEYWRQIRHTLDTLTPLDITVRIITPSGKVKWVRVNSNPEKQPDGSIVLYGVRTDITKLKELEAELAARLKQIQDTQVHLIQSEKMSALGQMVAGIAHELNTPIGYASNNVTLIRERFSLISNLLSKALKAQDAVYSGELEKALAIMQEIRTSQNGTLAELEETVRRTERLFIGISSGFEQMTNLVHSMRNFARLDEAEMKKADINEGIKNCLLMIGHMIKDKDVELTTEYGILPLVDCFPAQLNQVFLNLIGNAIHAVEEKPDAKVHIKTSLEQNYVVVRVQDNGKGIPKHVQTKIFDPFFTTKPVGKGTGLGLSISFDIIQKHKGSISFETEEGKGTTFIVKIPATDFLQTTS
jgi:PAS domain S-box-containing protein